MNDTVHILQARDIRAGLDLRCGQMALLEVTRDGRITAPYARVPWADAPQGTQNFPQDMAPHLAAMSGDFFCAPFCADDVEDAPLHGWAANAPWTLVEETRLPDGIQARFRLTRQTGGAVVEKVWRLRDDHPFLYQRHDFIGGRMRLPVAHHAMVDLRTGGVLRTSAKLWAETPATPPEPERGVLRYPARAADLTAFPGVAGPVDLTRYPIGARHEDFAMLVDDPSVAIGWATILRPALGDMAILLKPVAVLPQTMLWFSNGGRDYAPWNGVHVGVLGVEEACALGSEGWAAALAPNRLTERGIPTTIDLAAAPVVSVATAIGAVPVVAGAGQSLVVDHNGITLEDGRVLPFDTRHLDAR